MNNYVIIDADKLKLRIEELEKEIKFLTAKDAYGDIGKLSAYKQILSQSTPLIPEIEKAFDVGSLKTEQCFNIYNGFVSGIVYKDKENYISNLKLDI